MSWDHGKIDKRLRAAMANAGVGYYIWDLREDRCIFCTDKFAEFMGMSVDEYMAMDMTLSEDASFVHPEDRSKYLAAVSDILQHGKPIALDYRIVGRDGKTRYVREIETVTEFEDGVAIRAEGTIQDVTGTVEMEQRLGRAQKMEAIGNLTGGIAHDFNNILAVILGNLELLKTTESENVRTILIDAAIEASLSGADLTKKMLSFARRASLEPRVVDLNELVQSTKNWSSRIIPENIEFEERLGDGLWKIRVDQNSTESAILNLILNARDAMPDGGKLTIGTANVRVDAAEQDSVGEELSPGSYAVLSISDSGKGIPEHRLPLIFDPFFTTKPPGEGSGLGLSMVQGFMSQSGGAVRVRSEVGEGTTFELYFNAITDLDVASPPKVSGRRRAAGSGARVCLVEDDQALLKVLDQILTRAGYTVRCAPSGDEAMKLFEQECWCDVLVTDIVMPGSLNGPRLARRLREVNPELPVVFMTGYASEVNSEASRMRPEDRLLIKPVHSDDLIGAVESAILSGLIDS